MDNYIVCSNITKRFNKKNDNYALNNVNISINKGEFVVLGGENGSGKSTLMKIMIGLLIPDEGSVVVNGIDVIKNWKKLSHQIGVVLNNERCLYWKLTARENLEVFGNIYGVKTKNLKERITYLLEKVNLIDVQDNLVETYSTGMKRKLMLCKALIHNPDILFADELLNGLDPESCVEFINILTELNENGKTIVVISHILHTFPESCKLILMKQGSIILQDSISKLNIEKIIRLRCTLNNKDIEKVVNGKNFNDTITELINQGGVNIRVESDNIYDITRRLLS